MMGEVLVIVVTWNAMTWLERCLGSVRGSSVKADIMVVDNCSTDGTQEYVRRAFPDAVFVQNDSNAGFGAANNIGIKYALSHGYRYVYLLNQDAWVDKDCIGSMIASLENGYGLLSPVQTDARGNLDRNFERKCGKFLARHNDSPVVRVPFVMAAHWLVPTETFRIVGGFSPVFTQYGEDDNFIDRLHYHGLKCGVVRAATAVHDRLDRPSSKERRMRLKCVSVVVKLSNPSACFTGQCLILPFRLLGMSVKNRSWVPLRFFRELSGMIPVLKKTREESKASGAFIF